MQGIKALIGLHATLAKFYKKGGKADKQEKAPGGATAAGTIEAATAATISNTADHNGDNDEETNGKVTDIRKPYLLEPGRLRRLQTIIAGSIRPPHRLAHVGIIQDDKCPHPARKGERCDTMHIF
jgi:hypothetical protein